MEFTNPKVHFVHNLNIITLFNSCKLCTLEFLHFILCDLYMKFTNYDMESSIYKYLI